MNNAYIGIDPGQKGGVALVNGAGLAIEYETMPATVKGLLTLIECCIRSCQDNDELPRLIVELAQPMPRQGVVSVFTYGRHFGSFEVIAALLEIPYYEVRPSIWKKTMGLNALKANSIMLCERIFPTVRLIPARCRTKYDGIAEALLIAEWGRRKGL